MTISAYVLISCRSEALEVVREVRGIPAVKQAHALFGPLDAIAFVEADDLDALGRVVDRIMALPGVQTTDTRLTRT
jgi:DNA-binding Lrp family transcriptional regulator